MSSQADTEISFNLDEDVNDGERELFAKGGVYLVLADDSDEFHYALKKATKMAEQNKGHVGILSVIEKQSFQPWGRIAERVKFEQAERAQKRILRVAEHLNTLKDQIPAFYVEYGRKREVLTRVIKEDPTIKMLILGEGKHSSNPLVHYFINGALHDVQVPMLVVPDRPHHG